MWFLASLDGSDRAQTTQDFAVGIGIFLLAVALVFGVVPSVFAPYDYTPTGSQSAQADRAATTLLPSTAASETAPQLTTWNETTLRQRAGIPPTTRINASLRGLNNDTPVGATVGPSVPNDRSTTTRTRIVLSSDDRCTPTCRLVVEVW